MKKILAYIVLFSVSPSYSEVGVSLYTNGISQSAADTRYVNVTGDTMTGPLTLSGSSLTVTGSQGTYGLLVSSNISVAGGNVYTDATKMYLNRHVLFGTAKVISVNTEDASDNSYIQLFGAGASLATRGGGITLFGNESTIGGGQVKIDAGNVVGGSVTIRTGNNVDRLTILYGGNIGIGITTPNTLLHLSSGTFTIDGNVNPSIAVNGTIQPGQVAAANIAARVPGALGGIIICTDCVLPYSICVSTGATAGSWILANTALSPHCQ